MEQKSFKINKIRCLVATFTKKMERNGWDYFNMYIKNKKCLKLWKKCKLSLGNQVYTFYIDTHQIRLATFRHPIAMLFNGYLIRWHSYKESRTPILRFRNSNPQNWKRRAGRWANTLKYQVVQNQALVTESKFVKLSNNAFKIKCCLYYLYKENIS